MNARVFLLAALLVPGVALAASTQAATSKQPDPVASPYTTNTVTAKNADEKMTDARLASMLHEVNKMEMDAGKLASKHGVSAAVKNFGVKLTADHKQADNKLMAAAKKDHLDLNSCTPADKAKLDVDMKKMEQVKGMKGADFDRGFASVMYNGHGDVLNMLDKHEGDVQSAALKEWIKDARPVLEHHKQTADKLRGENRAQAR